jgi:hypothetical protein
MEKQTNKGKKEEEKVVRKMNMTATMLCTQRRGVCISLRKCITNIPMLGCQSQFNATPLQATGVITCVITIQEVT